MAPTWPSIMADGDDVRPGLGVTGCFARTSRSSRCPRRPFSITPQWPWLVYSHRHTSVTTRCPHFS